MPREVLDLGNSADISGTPIIFPPRPWPYVLDAVRATINDAATSWRLLLRLRSPVLEIAEWCSPQITPTAVAYRTTWSNAGATWVDTTGQTVHIAIPHPLLITPDLELLIDGLDAGSALSVVARTHAVRVAGLWYPYNPSGRGSAEGEGF